MTIRPTAFLKTSPHSTKILVRLDDDEVLKAVLLTPRTPHPRALPTLLEAIRSRSPDTVNQELWGLLLAYNLVRLEMERIADETGVAPTRISFVAALRLIINEWSWSTITTSPGAIPRHLSDLRDKIRVFVLPERRSDRVQPRAVKLKMSNYARKRPSPPRRGAAHLDLTGIARHRRRTARQREREAKGSPWVGALARYRGFGESLFPTKVGASILATARFQRPPVTPDTEVSTIRRCPSSQYEVYGALPLGSLHQATP